MIILDESQDKTSIIERVISNLDKYATDEFIIEVTSKNKGYRSYNIKYAFNEADDKLTTDIFLDEQKQNLRSDIMFVNELTVNRGTKLYKLMDMYTYDSELTRAKEYRSLFMTYLKKSINDQLKEINESVTDNLFMLDKRMVEVSNVSNDDIKEFLDSCNRYGGYEYSLNIDQLNLDDFMDPYGLLKYGYVKNEYDRFPDIASNYIREIANRAKEDAFHFTEYGQFEDNCYGDTIDHSENFFRYSKYIGELFDSLYNYNGMGKNKELIRDVCNIFDEAFVGIFNLDNSLEKEYKLKSYSLSSKFEFKSLFDSMRLINNTSYDNSLLSIVRTRHYLNVSALTSYILDDSYKLTEGSSLYASTSKENLELMKDILSKLKADRSKLLSYIEVDNQDYSIEDGQCKLIINKVQ